MSKRSRGIKTYSNLKKKHLNIIITRAGRHAWNLLQRSLLDYFKIAFAIGANPRFRSPSRNGSVRSSSRNRNAFLNSSTFASMGASQCAGTMLFIDSPQRSLTRSTQLRTALGFCAYRSVRTTGGTSKPVSYTHLTLPTKA